METYLMMLYVTLDQETALKTFFTDQGWTFCKPDLSVTTDKLGPAVGNTPKVLGKDSDVSPGIRGKRKANFSPRNAPKIKLVKIVSNTCATDIDSTAETVAQGSKEIQGNNLTDKDDINADLFSGVTFDDKEITDMIAKMKERKVNTRDSEEVEEVNETADNDIDDIGDEENDDTDDSIVGINDEDTEEKLDGTNVEVKSEIQGGNLMEKVSPQKKTPKVSYRTYSVNAMIEAYHAVKEDSMAIRKAARVFGVPEATLRKRVHGGVEVDCVRSGPKGLFTEQQEAKLIKHLTLLKEKNRVKTQRDVRSIASEYAKELGLRNKGFLTRQWFVCFQKRWGPPVSDLLSTTCKVSKDSKTFEEENYTVEESVEINMETKHTHNRAILKALGYT